MGDLLMSYDGENVTYDTIGNPNSLNGRSYVWEHGRELRKVTYGGTEWTNTYDVNGLRAKREGGGKTYSYTYNGSLLSRMTVGDDTLTFFYDASGNPLSLIHNGTTYYYATNLQGDVVALLNTSGTAVVTYTYDAWGKLLETGGSMASTLGALNPLRYRGYVYDTETGLYYLQSRYYSPAMGRFINGDDPAYLGVKGLLSYNLFAYCNNNPVMGYDPSGSWDWGWKEQAKLGVAIVLIGVAILLAAPTGGSSLAFGALAISSTTVAIAGTAVAATGAAVVGGALTQATVHYAKQSKKSDKEKATDKPSWVSRNDIDPNKSAQENAKDLMDEKYGANWPKGTREYSQIVKWINRCVRDLAIGFILELMEEYR